MTENKAIIKPRTQLDLEFFELNICKNKEDQPFLNVFSYSGKNFEEQKLGQVFGVIQVLDKSENSAYIPNLVAQVIKKEFYRDRKRNLEKAFEAALHKANLALTDLVQHEIIQWMGKFNAVVGVVQKNNFYFTQSGGGRILLIRNKLINDITRNLDDGEGIGHPIKTFSNISSGKIEIGDKLVFATESVFESVKWEELKRHSEVFSGGELDNIFRRTLELESRFSGAILINVNEKQILPPLAEKKKEEKIKNFFGAKLENAAKSAPKEKPPQKKINETAMSKPEEANKGNLEQTTEPAKKDGQVIYPKNNHIEDETDQKLSPFEKQPELFVTSDEELPKEKTGLDPIERIKIFLQKTKAKFSNAVSPKQPRIEKTRVLKNLIVKKKDMMAEFGIKMAGKLNFAGKKSAGLETKLGPLGFEKSEAENDSKKERENFTIISNTKTFFSNVFNQEKKAVEKIKAMDKKILAIAASAIIIIAVVLIFLKVFSKDPSPAKQPDLENETSTQNRQPKSNLVLENLASFDKNIKSMAFLSGRIYILTEEDGFFEINPDNKEKTEISLPNDMKNNLLLTQMPPLNLIFLINNETVFSYSPVTKKFDRNEIKFPQNMDVVSADAYLTYLYVLDKNSNQIFQYPRAAGGFGEGKTRLDRDIFLEEPTDMTIDGSIYVGEKSKGVKKFFKGKQNSFGLDRQLENPLVWAKNGAEEMVVIDSAGGKVFIMKNDGNIAKEMEDSKLESAKDFWYDQNKKAIYFADRNNEIQKLSVD